MEYNTDPHSYVSGLGDEAVFTTASQGGWTSVAGGSGQEGYPSQTEGEEGLTRSSAGRGRAGIFPYLSLSGWNGEPHGLTYEFFRKIKKAGRKDRLGKVKNDDVTTEIFMSDQGVPDNTTRNTVPKQKKLERLLREEIANIVTLTDERELDRAAKKCVELSDKIYAKAWDPRAG
ncbi:uncharacterized protein L203_104911 [Cryptococcus depauperatus CBS 7841]|uniref:Uncharacterized protein n=1 Tax=Cryptococcus depauperatus CBS 7841 TaxID=1295531 RepID=A0A1E3IMZ0_9TREE|nr:hypothetical protein L203_01879 [Cryptococcus depauperatus CBS 7841]